MFFTGLGVLLTLAQLAFGSPLVERQVDKAVQEVLDRLSSYSTATGDCGILLGVKFSTSTQQLTRTKTIIDSTTLSFKTITSVPPSVETKYYTYVNEWYESAYTVVPGTYTTTQPINVTFVATIIEVVRVTTLIPDPDNITTVTKTTGYREGLVTKFDTSTEIVKTTTTYTNPTPSPLLEYNPSAVSAACSVFLKAPVPQPFSVIIDAIDITTTSYRTTITGTRTEIQDVIWVTKIVDETFTLMHPRSSNTVTVQTTKTITEHTTSTTTVSLTRKTRQTFTKTISVPIATHTTTVTVTEAATATIKIPAVCKSPIPGSSPIFYRNGKGKRVAGVATATREECCTQCANALGCAGFEYYQLGDCYLIYVEEVDDANDVGRMSGHCPSGQLEGRFANSSAGGLYGVGLCWVQP